MTGFYVYGNANTIGNSLDGLNATVQIYNLPSLNSGVTSFISNASSSSTAPMLAMSVGNYNADHNPKTAIQIFADNGNIASGSCSLYSLSN